MKKELSESMEKALADLTKEPMIRLPGGYWGWAGWSIVGGTYYNANTIQSLVDRGRAEYVEFVRGFNGPKPIKVQVKA